MAAMASFRAPSNVSATQEWPIRLRLKGLKGEHEEFNGDYVLQHGEFHDLLAAWKLEFKSCWMYLGSSCPVVRFARDMEEMEDRDSFLNAHLTDLHPGMMWTGNFSEWRLEGQPPASHISLRPVLGRWESLSPDIATSQRPVARDQTEEVEAGAITLPYTKGRCHKWTHNAAIAELVQNWKDEIDAGAERSGHSSAAVKVSYSCKRNFLHLAVSTYHAVICSDLDEVILLGTLEVREEQSSLSVTLTNFSDKMFVEMLWDGWAGKDKQAGKRRGQFGDGLQSAVCVLSRDADVDLKIFSSGHMWSFDWSFPSEVARAHGKEALRVTTSPCKQRFIAFDCSCDTRIKVTGLPRQAFEESQFLFLCPSYEVLSSSLGDILLCEKFCGCIYVRDMRVLQHQQGAGVVSNRQGLNISAQNPDQSRDRIGFLGEAAKSLQVFSIWTHALSGTNRQAAELLYKALEDNHSLEARAFYAYATQTNQIQPEEAKLLVDVCTARFPNAFPILETDYKGHKIVTQKLKKTAVNISEKLFYILRKWPDFKTPEEYWKMQQDKLAQHAERIPWTEKYRCAVTIVQEALRTQVSYEVVYNSDPGDDIHFKLPGASGDQKVTVHSVCPDGPAGHAFIGVGSELVGRDFADGTERISCQQLRLSALLRGRMLGRVSLSQLVRSEGWRFPFKLQFLLRPAELNDDQFSLVCREDLEVPFVSLPGRPKLEQAKFVINTAGCKFHGPSDHYHCPYFASQGVCFCGVDHLLTAVLDEMEKRFNVHLNKIQRQWVDVEKNRLLKKHEKVYKLHKQQVPFRWVGAKGIQRLSLSYFGPSGGHVEPTLDLGSTYELTLLRSRDFISNMIQLSVPPTKTAC